MTSEKIDPHPKPPEHTLDLDAVLGDLAAPQAPPLRAESPTDQQVEITPTEIPPERSSAPEVKTSLVSWGFVSISAQEAEARFRSSGKWPGAEKWAGADTQPKPNQDAWAADEETGVFAVADGAGQYDGSEKAARLAANSFVQDAGEQIKRLLSGEDDFESAKAKVAHAVHLADQKILDAQNNGEMPHGAVTTLTGVAIFTDPSSGEKTAIAVNAGDSSTYLLRGGKLIPLTTEQSIGGNTLTDYLGGEEGSDSRKTRERHQVSESKLQPGDRLILCTDGLIGDRPNQRIAPETIAVAMQKHPDSQDAARALAELPESLGPDYQYFGRKAGGKPFQPKWYDDRTVLVVDPYGTAPKTEGQAEAANENSLLKRVFDRAHAEDVEYDTAVENAMEEILESLPPQESYLLEKLAHPIFRDTEAPEILLELLRDEDGENILVQFKDDPDRSDRVVSEIVQQVARLHDSGPETQAEASPEYVHRIREILVNETQEERVRDLAALKKALAYLLIDSTKSHWHPRGDRKIFTDRLENLLGILRLQQSQSHEEAES